MKNLVVLIALTFNTLFSSAQVSVAENVCKKVDPFDDSISYSGLSEIVYADGGDLKTEGVLFFLYPIERKDRLELSVIMKAYGMNTCVDEGSILNLIFENGQKLEMTNWNDFDCDGTNYFNLPIKNSELNLLKTVPIKGMRYRNQRDYQSFTMLDNMTEEASNMFIKILSDIDGINAGVLTTSTCKEN